RQRIVEQRQRAAENRKLRALEAARQRAGEHAGNRHHAVRGLMMLVQAYAVKAKLVRELQLIEIIVVELGPLLRIVMAVLGRHPRGGASPPSPGDRGPGAACA